MDTTGMPKTRAEAKAAGATHYFTGVPCTHGHIAPRKTKGVCVECVKAETAKHADKRAVYFEEYNSSEAGKAAKRAYYERNRAQVLARAAARPVEDKQRYRKKHKEENPDVYKAMTSLRRRRFRDATPPWLTAEHKRRIRELYRMAIEMTRTTGERYVVDHIVPLQGEAVCGLHVPWNLRVITREENLAKSNKSVL